MAVRVRKISTLTATLIGESAGGREKCGCEGKENLYPHSHISHILHVINVDVGVRKISTLTATFLLSHLHCDRCGCGMENCPLKNIINVTLAQVECNFKCLYLTNYSNYDIHLYFPIYTPSC